MFCMYSILRYFIYIATYIASICLYNTGHSDEVASWQYKQWATLGFVRGIATPSQSGQAFCSTQWMSLLFNIIETSLPTPSGQLKLLDSSTLLQQVCKYFEHSILRCNVCRFKYCDCLGSFYHHGKVTITLNIRRN